MMKTLSSTLIILLLFPLAILANDNDTGKYSKQKNVKKAYIVNADAGIDISNSYGNVFVTTWDESKIEIDVLIKVSGDNEDWVNKKIDAIDIDFEALKHLVTAKTVISNSAANTKGKRNSFEINYTIKIPKNGGVKINNKYGDVISGDLLSNVNIKCKYGKITLAKLNGSSNILDIEYCSKSTVDYVKSGTISADYSGLTINDFGKINLKADYTDINFYKGDDLKYDCSYGKLNLGKIGSIDGTGDYLTIKIDEIANNLTLDTKYSKLTAMTISAKAGNITINSAYTSIEAGFNAGYAFDFAVALKYAAFKHDSDVEINSKQEAGFSKNYQGFHKKSGINKIMIDSEYGNVSLHKNN